jgi:hypothetical protein
MAPLTCCVQSAANEEIRQRTEVIGSKTWLSRVRAERKRIKGCWADSTWTVGNSTKAGREQPRSRPRTVMRGWQRV